jgi:hypothetical protein
VDARPHAEGGTPYRTPAEAHGALPPDNSTFVFCNFNQHYKLDPPTFTLWLNALRRANAGPHPPRPASPPRRPAGRCTGRAALRRAGAGARAVLSSTRGSTVWLGFR